MLNLSNYCGIPINIDIKFLEAKKENNQKYFNCPIWNSDHLKVYMLLFFSLSSVLAS